MLLAVFLSNRVVDDVCEHKVNDDVIRKVECITELVVIRDNNLSTDVFTLVDIRDVISFLCTSYSVYLFS